MGHLEAEPVTDAGGEEEGAGIEGKGMDGSPCKEGGVGRESGR